MAPTRHRLRLIHLALRMRNNGPRCQPSFLIVGAQKAGTTSLFRYLVRHPQVVAPITKEIRYFDRHSARPLDWYWAHFPLASEAHPAKVTGEASPYLAHPMAPQRVAGALPNAKLIVLLRDPIGRAVSDYHHSFRGGRENRPIEEALLADESLRTVDMEAIEKGGPLVVSRNYVARGYYADQLERWFGQFDQSQILILNSEGLFADPARIYNQVLDFLDLPPFQLKNIEPYNAGRYRKYLSKKLVLTLADHYAKPNQRLYRLTDTDFGWEDAWFEKGADANLEPAAHG